MLIICSCPVQWLCNGRIGLGTGTISQVSGVDQVLEIVKVLGTPSTGTDPYDDSFVGSV